MKIFKNFVLYSVIIAFFFSQSLGVHAHSLKSHSQESHFTSIISEKNKGIKKGVIKVSDLTGIEAEILGLIVYLAYLFTRKLNSTHLGYERMFDASK
ncbi:hypothetical protein [Bartonella vinsonii]|uniref:Uncharacterized protein n=1 Tax=Bartonella vinsonii subsp. berkhoffii str. Tweed TaxID=1094502 RepID=N6US00_BARVB|nr:hypothetical protein [Bartonella vinsonii]AGF76396.1 hypothetical protein BVwin_13210 [Bartonella vinsonii subsp. berkhoffii str. Winnie]ENN92943.1 putative protein, membrane-bound [Bartonella vinsonii subsp. berkhoffii str. Tweed]